MRAEIRTPAGPAIVELDRPRDAASACSSSPTALAAESRALISRRCAARR